MEQIKLTEFSHGAGCGCKISPALLESIVKSTSAEVPDKQLLVGNHTKDDAAVYDLGDGSAVISTTDFFMPIADDPFTFGRIAAANAISDVYAMGGKPMMAIAILGWPVDKLAADVAQQVVEGGRAMCRAAGIPLAGGHSIDSPEPIFGLAVTGRVLLPNLKRNDTAKAGDLLYLSKPLGVGILSTAQKQKKLLPEHQHIAIDSMCQLNDIGAELGALPAVHAMTDVTGFGLFGHLLEMCQGSGLAAHIDAERVPVLPEAAHYLAAGCIAGGARRNIQSYGQHLGPMTDDQRFLFCDPQTSGGLLIALDPQYQSAFESQFSTRGLQRIGQLVPESGPFRIQVAET
ncbi:selenide, water dikinase SelD [Reinekea sp. G2M2-21]|uniref:selenide, water dikinase SelD n=1 Tax=Reinekea sp. G2M2-21 TaxID=2788942 RepID=UPI0018AA20D4|nr:selenide, water dikinase SelD [Reinekea sp. G2M2-21]